MNINVRRVLRALIYTSVGALIGLAMYLLVGCPDGTCPLTSSPFSSMAVMGLLGFMMSGSICGCLGGSCSVPQNTSDKDRRQ